MGVMDMIYTVVNREKETRYGLDAKDIDTVRRHVFWKEGVGMFDIYKNRKLLGTVFKGTFYCTYEPDTGYGRSYEVIGNGALRDGEWEG